MIRIIWEFRVKEDRKEHFEAHYGSLGTWVTFFRRSPSYRGTILARDSENPTRYVTIDTWENLQAFRTFKNSFSQEYAAIDQKFGELMEQERMVGCFEQL